MASFSNYDIDKKEHERVISIAHTVIDTLSKTIIEMEKKANEVTGKIMPVEDVGNLISCTSDISSFDKNWKNVVEKVNSYIEDMMKLGKEKHEANLVAINNNKQVIEKIKFFMTNIGIPTIRNVRDYKSRSRYPKYITESAGYLKDINDYIKISDGFSTLENNYKKMKGYIENYRKKCEAEEQKKITEEEKIKQHSEKEKLRVVLVVKYNLDFSSNMYDITQAILSKDKYLRLAYYLEKNRRDWTNGYDYAETGLDKFEVVDEIDKEIHDDISSHFGEGWDGDGRCFRDCKWNYSVLYGMADKDLLADLELIRKYDTNF